MRTRTPIIPPNLKLQAAGIVVTIWLEPEAKVNLPSSHASVTLFRKTTTLCSELLSIEDQAAETMEENVAMELLRFA